MGQHAPKSTTGPKSTAGTSRISFPPSLSRPSLSRPSLSRHSLSRPSIGRASLSRLSLSLPRLRPPQLGLKLSQARLHSTRLNAAAAAARNTSLVTRASAAAGILVVVVTVAAYLTDSNGSGAVSMAGAINSLTTTSSVRQLVKEHQFILQLDSASQVLTRAAQPVTVDAETLLNQPTSATATTGGTGIAAAAPPANPTAAEALGRELLAAAGFGTSADWACLYSLWNRESGWNVYAENPSGAYGIPQAYPGSKMAEFGADWQTNPATQIKWGLSYVDGLYGGPCNAWDHEVSYGYY